MNTKISLRAATQSDIPTLRTFEQGVIAAEHPFAPQLKPAHVIYYDFEHLIESEDLLVVVVERDGELCGSGYACIKESRPCLKHSRFSYLGFMYVEPMHRRSGIVQMIIDHLAAWSKSKGAYELQLDVYDQNEPAILAYEKYGFRKSTVMMRMEIDGK